MPGSIKIVPDEEATVNDQPNAIQLYEMPGNITMVQDG